MRLSRKIIKKHKFLKLDLYLFIFMTYHLRTFIYCPATMVLPLNKPISCQKSYSITAIQKWKLVVLRQHENMHFYKPSPV